MLCEHKFYIFDVLYTNSKTDIFCPSYYIICEN